MADILHLRKILNMSYVAYVWVTCTAKMIKNPANRFKTIEHILIFEGPIIACSGGHIEIYVFVAYELVTRTVKKQKHPASRFQTANTGTHGRTEDKPI